MATKVVHAYAPYVRPRNKQGCYIAGEPVYSAAQIENEKRKHAAAWRRFRATYLYSQAHLASALNVSRRTVTAVENGAVIPQLRVLRAFRNLVRQEKAAAAAA
jgi:DNA-binding XRE family transcriptional regulator